MPSRKPRLRTRKLAASRKRNISRQNTDREEGERQRKRSGVEHDTSNAIIDDEANEHVEPTATLHDKQHNEHSDPFRTTRAIEQAALEHIESERAWLTQECTEVTADEIDQMHGPDIPPFDETWTKTMEFELAREWKRSCMGEAFKRFPPLRLQKTIALWRICMRLLRCHPFAILSPMKGFEYAGPSKHSRFDEGTRAAPLWSAPFCDVMMHLMAHSLFSRETGVNTFVMLLQYAIIRRSDDRRPWELHCPTDSAVLNSLKDVVRQGPLPCSVHEVHRYLRSQATLPPSLESDILFHLGESITVRGEFMQRVTPWGSAKYFVRLDDLRGMIKALDSFSRKGAPMFQRTKLQYHVHNCGHPGDSVPTDEEIRDLMRRGQINEMRKVKLRCLQSESRGDSTISMSVFDAWFAQVSAPRPRTQGQDDVQNDSGRETMPRNSTLSLDSGTNTGMRLSRKMDDINSREEVNTPALLPQPPPVPSSIDSSLIQAHERSLELGHISSRQSAQGKEASTPMYIDAPLIPAKELEPLESIDCIIADVEGRLDDIVFDQPDNSLVKATCPTGRGMVDYCLSKEQQELSAVSISHSWFVQPI